VNCPKSGAVAGSLVAFEGNQTAVCLIFFKSPPITVFFKESAAFGLP
jgi:hypothetical protein